MTDPGRCQTPGTLRPFRGYAANYRVLHAFFAVAAGASAFGREAALRAVAASRRSAYSVSTRFGRRRMTTNTTMAMTTMTASTMATMVPVLPPPLVVVAVPTGFRSM